MKKKINRNILAYYFYSFMTLISYIITLKLLNYYRRFKLRNLQHDTIAPFKGQ